MTKLAMLHKMAAPMATSPKVMMKKKRLAEEQRIKKNKEAVKRLTKRLRWAKRLTTLHCKEGCCFERSDRLFYQSPIKGSKPFNWRQCRKCGTYEVYEA